MTKLLILQNVIMPYRKPVYNRLACHYHVTVLHSGTPTAGPTDAYREIIVPFRKVWPFMFQRNIFKEISSGRYDVIVAMFDLHWPAYILPVLRCQRRYGKWIFWGHGYGRTSFLNYARDWLMKRADAVLLYGSENVDRLKKSGVQEQRIFIAENTIHVPNHCDYSGHSKNSLLYVGRLQKRKRIDLLIVNFARIREKISDDIRVEIVGEGKKSDDLQRKVCDLGLEERVTFHGSVHKPDVLAQLFARALAYVSPGHVGLGVLHSFAYGVPVVTSQVDTHAPEFYNLEHRVNGLIYKEKSELEEALIEICNSPALSANLGHNAYRHYSRKRTLRIMLNGFKKAIES